MWWAALACGPSGLGAAANQQNPDGSEADTDVFGPSVSIESPAEGSAWSECTVVEASATASHTSDEPHHLKAEWRLDEETVCSKQVPSPESGETHCSFALSTPGFPDIIVDVVDLQGRVATDEVGIQIVENPAPTATVTGPTAVLLAGMDYVAQGTVEDDALDQVTGAWLMDGFEICDDAVPNENGATSCPFQAGFVGFHELRLEVTDGCKTGGHSLTVEVIEP